MTDYENQKRDFEKKYTTVVNQAVINLSAKFDKLFIEKNIALIENTIEKAKKMLKSDYNIVSKIQISYDIANAFHDLRMLNENYNESYFEKEIYYHRNALDLYENNFRNDKEIINEPNNTDIANYIAMRIYTNLGNSMKSIGRYIVAIDCFQNALNINTGFSMASLNLSLVLFNYAKLQNNSYESKYYHHACYHYYKETEKHKINLENQEYLDGLNTIISQFSIDYIKDYLNKPVGFPSFSVNNDEEIEYRNYLLSFRLFLEPCLDIFSSPCFAVDSLQLSFETPLSSRQKEFVGLFNQIKQEYNLSRYLWYKTTVVNEPTNHFVDQEMDFINLGDYADFTLREGLLRTAFRNIYSVFDRIGFFINEYFGIGLINTKVSFKNIWKSELRDGNGKILFTVPNPILSSYKNNPLIIALYWLQKDFFEDKKTNITNPNAEPIFQMRNNMEHNCLRTGKKSFNTNFTKYTTEANIEAKTYKLLKLAREAIIYLSLSINFEQKMNRPKI